jgi:adenylate kinase
MGAQGAGKGTQSALVSERFSLPIVATGEILRKEAEADTPFGHQLKAIQNAGKFVSDDILADIVRKRTSQEDCRGGYIFDGFPRTLPQAKLLEEMAIEQGHSLTVISIDVPQDLLHKRLAGRRTCSACERVYNIYFQPSRQESICDVDGAALFIRPDDRPEVVAERLALYDEWTRPLIDYFNQSGRVHVVDGTRTPQEVFSSISGIINSGKDELKAGS